MEWVSVKDRLPEKNCQCICACKGLWTMSNTACMLRFDIKSKKFYGFNGRVEYGVSNVTHWIEVPEPPKGE